MQLRHRWTDGTTHVLFEPLELLEHRLALTPLPRANLILNYGVLACPRCGQRTRLIALIDQADAVQRILRRLGLPTEAPEPDPAPPTLYGTSDIDCCDDQLTFDLAC